MYYVTSLQYRHEGVKEFEDQADAEQFAIRESWAETAYGLYEGDDWDNAEITAIAFNGEIFWK